MQALYELKWLPMEERIQFKILSIVYKCLKKEAPQCLQDLITVKQFARSTRQASNGIMLTVPKTKCKTFADRSFSVSGPMLWNSLSFTIRSAKTLTIFQRQLKQHLFEIKLLQTLCNLTITIFHIYFH